jgi:hypothetical protein
VFYPRRDSWQGWERLDLQVIDFQPGPEPQLELLDVQEYLAQGYP